MKLDIASVKNIIGNGNEVMIYGVGDSEYYAVGWALRDLGYSKYQWCDYPFARFDHDSQGARGDCKATLTGLILENFRREKAGDPIIPLLFCVGKKDSHTDYLLKAKDIAASHSKTGNITHSELRRCYKLFSEMGPEVKKIAEQTFKFVIIKEAKPGSNDYILEQVKPFWEDINWAGMWAQRKANSLNSTTSTKYLWRDVLTDKIKKISP